MVGTRVLDVFFNRTRSQKPHLTSQSRLNIRLPPLRGAREQGADVGRALPSTIQHPAVGVLFC